MGQSQSQNDKVDQVNQLYTDYIQKQQEMLYQQQQQINELYNMNLHQQTPPSISFQSNPPDQSLLALPSNKLDPYKILNLPKVYDESMLKKSYLKKAMKAHPDRGGSKDEFQKVSIAYTVLKKKTKRKRRYSST